jgi:ATP-dependent RNA helicase DeaD
MTFAELNLHPALAATLAARGYTTATPVQAAVLDPACAGRDLLVSSETGSGKTVAFGGALAETLLGPASADGTAGKAAHGPNPVALVVVPTRELAAQVREELSWLLQRTGLRSAAFTGGTPVGGDLRVLQRGVDLIIGTPGRLVDLLRRQRLVLTDLRVVVLDEADEMLDLGFREDLETILKTAPATRRTLLLSATLPTEIRSMARKYQRDALAVDPRKRDGAGGATQGAAAHGDITYVAHLIAGGDRLPAVVNVLRAAGNARAIVFCTTREGVATTHAALVARGFSAVAISGDRVQAERDRALDQLRRGEVQVLVATNVAARGLHLPDVDLIVHADLPLNAESLTHRSGRTGRAGRKGTAVVIARVVERHKAERLLASAHVKPVWTPAPSAKTIAAAALGQLLQELVSEPEPDGSGADDILKQLDGKLELPALARKLLTRELARLPAGEPLARVPMPPPGSGARDDRGSYTDRSSGPSSPRSRAELSRDGVQFRVNLGENDQADPRWLLPLICRRGGVTRREVGAIRIGARETLFEIAGNAARDFAAAAAEIDPRARHVVIARADAPSSAPQPARPGPAHETYARPSPERRPNHDHPDRAQAARARPVRPHADARPAQGPAVHPRPAHAQATANPRPAHAQGAHRQPAHAQASAARPVQAPGGYAPPVRAVAAHARPGHPPGGHLRPAQAHPPHPHPGPRKHQPKGPGKHRVS